MNVYETGTVAVTNGQTAVIGSGTEWLDEAREGDLILIEDRVAAVFEVAGDGAIVLSRPWTGPTAAGVGYSLIQVGNGRNSMWDVNIRLARLVERVGRGDVPGTPDPDTAVKHLGSGVARGRSRGEGRPASIKFGSGLAVGKSRATGGSTTGTYDLMGMDGDGLIGMDGQTLQGMDAPATGGSGQTDALAFVMTDAEGTVLTHMDGELIEGMDAP